MDKLSTLALVAIAALCMSSTDPADQQIKWVSWEEAVELNKQVPRKIFVDIYTDWCGWCKRMDATTFQDPEVVRYVSEYFYAVKLNAEQRETINFRDVEYKFHAVEQSRRGGIHTLAYALLDGRTSYPSFVMLNERFERIAIMPGYKKPDQLLKELKFAAEEVYKERSWKEYSGGSE